jgi:hypothetical protein
MADDRSPRAVPVPLLLGEAAGRVRIPLSGLPDGVIAVTVPRKDPEGEVSVPVDRKGRPAWRKADLVAEEPAQAFTPPAELSPSELAWFLETKDHRRWQAIETKFGDRAWSLVTALIRDGGAVVRVSVSDIKSWEPRTLRLTHAWAGQAVDLLREMRGQPVPGEARAALLEIMTGVPEFSDEATLLAAVPDDAPLRGPDGSRTGTSAWSVYDAAIRTAAYFLQNQRPDSPLTEREVAAHALPDSKEWTPARRAAFELLVGESVGDRLAAMDHDIRVRGRLRWSIGPVVADAMRGYPWIGLPSGGIHIIGQIERDVRGVLVVENADAFQYVCLWPDVTDTWLCVWGRGSTTDGVVNFLRTMNDLPIAAWCDLDARGIEIVTELAGRLGREITPVGMGTELFVGGKQYVPKNLADSLKVAKKMTAEGHPALRDLARAIVASGGLGCEQETLYDVVPPTLARELAKLE